MGKVIHAVFRGARVCQTEKVWQYDYGHVLKIMGPQLPDSYEVFFSNAPHGTAKKQIGNADGVTMPDEYLETGKPVYAWVFLHEDENSGATEYMSVTPVEGRARGTEARPTPIQQDVITQAIAAANHAVELTAQDVIDANAASLAAVAAQGNAEDAQRLAEAAQTAAESAQRLAEGAKTGAEAAQEKAETAQGKAEEAQAGAEAAAAHQPMIQSDTWWVWDATQQEYVDTGVQAQGPEGDPGSPGVGIASIAKTGTSGLVDTYTITLTNGNSYTFDVTNGEDGAPGVGIASATLNSDYTLTLTYTNGNSDTVGPIRGAQGEPGAPGPQGAGITSISKTGISGLVDTYTITLSNGNSSTFTVTNGEDGDPGTPGVGISSAELNSDYTLTLHYTNGNSNTVGPIRGEPGPTGNGIASIAKTATAGLVDTYTITYTNGNETTFTVTNGAPGTTTYSDLSDKPSINSVTLSGNKSLSDIGAVGEEIIAPDYAELTYPVAEGAYCIHEGALYKAKQAIQTSEAWTAAHWEEVQVGGELDALKSGLNSKAEIDDSSKTGIDLDVSDEDGNVVLRLKDGEIQTKNFYSATASDAKVSTKQGVDLDVSDEDGNVLLRLKNGHIQTKKFTSETLTDRTTFVTVKTSGGDFTTLRGAIDYITTQGDADPIEHPYVIQIYPGTYNVMEDYTDDEINTADVADYHNGFVGPYLDDGVSLVGMGDRDSVILYGYLDPSDYVARVRGNISTLNIRGNVTIENLTVIADSIRYCVHDDFTYPSSKGQYQRIVRNCKFIGQTLAHTPACTWGGGMSGAGENAIFENCDFGTDFGFHFDASKSVHITYRNCRGRKLRLSERAGSYHHYITIENSDIEMISLMRPSGVTTQHIFIEANGCEKTYVSSNDGDIILTGAITKGHLTNLPVGTLVRRVSTSGNGYEATSDPMTADGVIVANDDYYSYIQRTGYINTRILGMTSFNRGDYITIDGNDKLTTGGTASNAVGVISFISMDSDTVDQGIGFIKMLVGGME